MVPLSVLARVAGPVEFTPEVPVFVRWNFPGGGSGESWLVTMDPGHAEDRARAENESVIRVPSLAEDAVREAVVTMHAARVRGEWERAMTHESLLPYLEEEAREFADAVRSSAPDSELRSELGDVLLQVLFHAEIASERGAFDFDGVAASFVEKMRSRSPYLFDGSTGPVPVADQERFWAEGKRRERGE